MVAPALKTGANQGLPREVIATAQAWRSAGHAVALATVAAIYECAPLPPGSMLAISASGETVGAISWGCGEAQIAAAAAEVIESGSSRCIRVGDGDPLLGDGSPCGGSILVLIENWHGDGEQAEFARRLEAGLSAVRETPIPGSVSIGRPQLLPPDSESEVNRSGVVLDESGKAWLRVKVAPPTRLVIVGASEIGAALCAAAAAVGWHVSVVDPREQLSSGRGFAAASRLLKQWPSQAFEDLKLDPECLVVVVGHHPSLDDQALLHALAAGAGYIGALGSRKAHEARCKRLQELGVSADDLSKISAPIGLDLGAESPAEVAVSILAELIAHRHGRGGEPLSSSDGPIHSWS